MLAAAQLKQLPSQLSALTELHLAYQCKSASPPPNLAAESAAWQDLPLRQLSLIGVAVPAAALQQLAELAAGLTSLELDRCSFESSPRQVAKVLSGMRTLRVFKMSALFLSRSSHSHTLMAGTRELLQTLGHLNLHTLEIADMPLGSIAQELPGDWRLNRQLLLQRLLPQLQWLDVRGTRVTPAGVAHLPGVKLLNDRQVFAA
uniref:Uncharacterized protein n=1 Tax=Tetradesmus obliquus TaxID=3088 RepID=A0A383W516_TETOB|eukprot:jgi/Sobl393_1/6173/SZX72104.1